MWAEGSTSALPLSPQGDRDDHQTISPSRFGIGYSNDCSAITRDCSRLGRLSIQTDSVHRAFSSWWPDRRDGSHDRSQCRRSFQTIRRGG